MFRHFHYTTHGIEVSFFYAKSRTCSFIVGNKDTIAPAVSKGNETLLNWINKEIQSLEGEQFFHKDYDETLVATYGEEYKEELVVEGGKTE